MIINFGGKRQKNSHSGLTHKIIEANLTRLIMIDTNEISGSSLSSSSIFFAKWQSCWETLIHAENGWIGIIIDESSESFFCYYHHHHPESSQDDFRGYFSLNEFSKFFFLTLHHTSTALFGHFSHWLLSGLFN